jgi:hypothetical protein
VQEKILDIRLLFGRSLENLTLSIRTVDKILKALQTLGSFTFREVKIWIFPKHPTLSITAIDKI